MVGAMEIFFSDLKKIGKIVHIILISILSIFVINSYALWVNKQNYSITSLARHFLVLVVAGTIIFSSYALFGAPPLIFKVWVIFFIIFSLTNLLDYVSNVHKRAKSTKQQMT